MQTLVAVAKSVAKLNLRPEVVEEDALLSCFVYEENISVLSGYSFLGVDPSPHIGCSSLEEALGKLNDRRMRKFETELRTFFQIYLSDGLEE